MRRLLTWLLQLSITHQALALGALTPKDFISQNNIVTKASSAQQKLMQSLPYEIELTPKGIKLDGQYTLLRGGSIQWFRLPEGSWEDRIKKFKNMGFNTIDMYIAWNQIEPTKGSFNFETPNIRHFLDLAAQYGLFVSVRPGPYITNEMDGGGLPAWLTRDSTKKNYDRDGKVNIRTHDPDFIEAVNDYFTALNEVLGEYTADKGGPIILYTIENEFNWFERAFQTDKLFWYDGGLERPLQAKLDIQSYFSSLRDIVRNSGITLPIISCPGDGKISSLGDVADVVPFPNIYEWANPGQPEEISFDLLNNMKNPNKHNGIYTEYPSGSLELSRSAQEMRRLTIGGLDAFFVFNLMGIMQTGYMNGMTMAARIADEPPHWGSPDEKGNNWLKTIFDFSHLKRLVTGFIAPEQGYFGNVIDYMGAVSSSGVLRELYYLFRRDNMFYESVEHILARAETPYRVKQNADGGETAPLEIKNPNIGVRQRDGVFHYWHELPEGPSFLSLVNQSGKKQAIGLEGIRYKDLLIPRFQPFHVPNSYEPKKTYSQFLTINLALSEEIKLSYSTSEILSIRPFNDETLVVLYGSEGDVGELALSGLVSIDESQSNLIRIEEHEQESITLTYPYQHGLTSSFITENGHKIRILITTRKEAGRFWFLRHRDQDILVAGVDYIDDIQERSNDLEFRYSYDWQKRNLMILSPVQINLAGHQIIKTYQNGVNISFYERESRIELPELPRLVKASSISRVKPQTLHAEESIEWEGEPRPLEKLGIFRGHAWYNSTFQIQDLKKYKGKGQLYIHGASDFIGIYINDHYLGTVAPVGTEINNFSSNPKYRFPSLKPFLKEGENRLQFRTEIWGRGSFMFGRGKIVGTKARIPSIAYDGSKGLFGPAFVDKIKLNRWSVRRGIAPQANFSDRATFHSGLPPLQRGDILWQSFTFMTKDLPSEKQLDAPLILELSGERSKATIFLNEIVIGRWLSDKKWLSQGTWLRPQRNMWSIASADNFPLPRSLLKSSDEGPNTIKILFEDTSKASDPVGYIDNVALDYNKEGILWQPGQSHEGNIETSYNGPDGLGVRGIKSTKIQF